MSQTTLKALCNETRLKLLTCVTTNPTTVTNLISKCGLSQSAVSQHLIKLKEAGLIKSEKKGRQIIYSLTEKKTGEISQLLLSFIKDLK